MNDESRPSRARIEAGFDRRPVETAYRVESDPGWIDFGDILGAFRRNLWLIAIGAAVGVGVAGLLVTRQKTRYTAMAIIRLIERTAEGTEGMGDIPMGKVDPIMSEIVVLTSRNVIGRAVDREGFRIFSAETGAPATFIEAAEVTLAPEKSGIIDLTFSKDSVSYGPAAERRTVAYGEPIVVEGARFVIPSPRPAGTARLKVVPEERAIDQVASGVDTQPMAGTGGVSVFVTGSVPRFPATAVNAIVQEYQKVNAERAKENVRRRRTFLEDQLHQTDSLLMVAQTGLSGFRAREQSYSAAGRFTSEQGNLISVEIQQAQMQADLRMFEDVLSRIQSRRQSGQAVDLTSMMSVPGISTDPLVSQLFSQLLNYRTERENMTVGAWARAETHPEVRRLDTLIATTENRLVDAVQSHIGSVRAQINALGSLRGRAAAKMSELPRTEVQEVYLTQNVSALQQMADQLRDQYQAVRLEEAGVGGDVEIVQLAGGALATRTSPWNKLFLGLISGLMIGAGLALLKERLDKSINRPEDVEGLALVPNLAVIPATSQRLIGSGENGGGRRSSLDSPGDEAYRILRTNLFFSQGKLRTLVVTSAAPGEGKTMTSANLAAAIALQGRKVLLMECDLRRPSLNRYFESRTDGADLSGVLLEKRSMRDAIHPSGIAGLDLLLASRAIPHAGERLAGAEMKEMIGRLSEQYDMVILDTSPLLVAADATVLGAIADGVLIVVRTAQTHREALHQAVQQLTLVGANIVGTVLNDPDGAVARYGTYYDYSSEYESA